MRNQDLALVKMLEYERRMRTIADDLEKMSHKLSRLSGILTRLSEPRFASNRQFWLGLLIGWGRRLTEDRKTMRTAAREIRDLIQDE